VKKVFVSVPLFSFIIFSSVQAEENSDSDAMATMEAVVVTATRDAQETRRVPANVTVITEAEINQTGATTVVEVLDKLESVQFRNYSGNASQALIDLRGFGGDNPFGKTLILLDGRRLNNPDMSSVNWMQIPVNIIEKIEIVRGSSGVLYGDAAIGGVINIITRKGKGKPVFNASMIAGSYGLHDERVSVTGAADKWTYALAGENNFSSGYRDRSRYSAQGGGFDVGYSANDLLNVSLGVSFNRVDYQLPGALTKEQMDQDRRQYQPAMPDYFMNANDDNDGRDKYTNVNLGLKSFWGPFGQMEINFLYGKKDLQSNMPSWYSFNYADTDAETYGITPKYILAEEIFGFHNKIIMGVDYYHEPYQKTFYSDRERTTRSGRADLRRESLGCYIRDEFSILKNLILSGGVRLERTSIEGDNHDVVTPSNNFDSDKKYSAEAYEAGLTWLWGEQSRVFAKYATVYRIPFLDEIASFNGYSTPTPFLDTLEQEKGTSAEIGAEYYPVKNLRFGLTLFRIDMKDEIQYVVYDPVQYLGENRNVGKTRHDGAEVSLSYLWPDYVKVFGNYTYHKATFEIGANNKKEMPLVPRHMANAGLEIYLPFHLTLRPEIQHVSSAFLSGDNDNSTEKLGGYTLLNIYAYCKPQWGRYHWTVFAGVDNVADVKYSSFGLDYEQYGMPNFYYPMPGIAVKGGLSVEF